jgi:hypothetical protein
MMDDIEDLLAWWLLGCISSEDVVRWADTRIEALDRGAALPAWLMAISLVGPQEFLKQAKPDDPHPKTLSFAEAFRAKVEATDPLDDDAVGQFESWAARNAMGEDLSLDEVQAGYEIDDLLDYDARAARVRAKELLMTYRPSCRRIGAVLPWWRRPTSGCS